MKDNKYIFIIDFINSDKASISLPENIKWLTVFRGKKLPLEILKFKKKN